MTDDFDNRLAEAEAAIAALAPDEHGFVEIAGWCLDVVMREYVRRGRVVAAAEALAERWGERPRVERDDRWCSPQLDQRLDALASAVCAAREPRTGEGT